MNPNMNCFPYSPLYDADMAVSCYYYYVNVIFNDDQQSLKKDFFSNIQNY